MANNNTHINYTLADIEKYLQGKMSAAEMHQMEKAALQDPFLADAIEGFGQTNMPVAKQHLNNIDDDTLIAPAKADPHYTFTDIEQYLQKNMDTAAMHQLEKAALQDPFLADAIEGFEQTNMLVAKQHLHNIAISILGEEKEDAKIVAMPIASNNRSWLRIAALIILMAGAGSAIWLVNKSNNIDTPVAAVKQEQVTQDPAIPKTATAPPTANDTKNSSATLIAPDKVKANAFVTEPQSQANKGDVTTIAEADITPAPIAKQEVASLDNAVNKKAVIVPDKKYNDAYSFSDSVKNISNQFATANKAKENAELKKNAAAQASSSLDKFKIDNKDRNASFFNQLRGRVVNTEGQGVPYATLNLNRNDRRLNSANGTVSDANGYFNVQAADTVINAEVAVIGYTQRNVNLNAHTTNTIVMERAGQSLAEEIVTTGYGTKRNQSAAILGTPVGGIKSFEEYVSKKKEALKKDSTAEDDYGESLVELEFDVDKLGKPYNISIVSPRNINTEISNKAIQIVKEGPAWIADKKKKKAKVAIKF